MLKNPKAFIDYLPGINDVYGNLKHYNLIRKGQH